MTYPGPCLSAPAQMPYPGMAAAVGFVSPLILWEICLISAGAQTGELSRDKMGISTPASFRSLRVTLISVIPPRIWICFVCSILPKGRVGVDSSLKSFYLAFSADTAFAPQAKDPMWGLHHLPSMSNTSTHLEMTSRWIHGPNGPTVSQTLVNCPFVTWSQMTPL